MAKFDNAAESFQTRYTLEYEIIPMRGIMTKGDDNFHSILNALIGLEKRHNLRFWRLTENLPGAQHVLAVMDKESQE